MDLACADHDHESHQNQLLDRKNQTILKHNSEEGHFNTFNISGDQVLNSVQKKKKKTFSSGQVKTKILFESWFALKKTINRGLSLNI